MGRQPSRVVLALATRGALSFETSILFGQLAFALPPHGPRSPTAKGMESKGLRARVRSRKTSPVSPLGALTGTSTCGLRMMKKPFGGPQSLSSRRLLVGGVELCRRVSFNVPLGGRVDDRGQSDRRRRSAISSLGDASRQFNASVPVHSRTSLSPTFPKSAADPN